MIRLGLLLWLLSGSWLLAFDRAHAADCDLSKAKVVSAYPVVGPGPVELGDVIAIKVVNTDGPKDARPVLDCGVAGKQVVVYLDGLEMNGLTPYPPVNTAAADVRFTLKHTAASSAAWAQTLGAPGFGTKKLHVSVGVEKQYPIPADDAAILEIRVLRTGWIIAWGALMALALFFVAAAKGNLIRGGTPVGGRIFSLARSQMAWWLFLVVGSYLLIGMVTGDYATSLNGTALMLVGIGAGTYAASAAIDASNDNAATAQAQLASAQQLQADIRARAAQIASLEAQIAAVAPNDANRLVLQKTLSDVRMQQSSGQSALARLSGESQGWLADVLSDANGMNFHRFQILVWSVVLGVIFVSNVYAELAMPEFNSSLLALQGLSAGTFVALKIPEATTPKV